MFKRMVGKFANFIKVHPTILVCILAPFLAAIVSRCNILDPLKFITVQAVLVFLPGYALQRLIGISYQNKLVRNLVSYATGYILSIIMYLVLLMVSSQHLSLYIALFLSLVSAIYLYFTKRSNTDGEFEEKEQKRFTIILFLSFCFACVIYQCGNLSPLLREGNVLINQDLLFWMRNSVAATKGYPLPELSVAGLSLHYHYFSSIHMAFLNLTTGIEMFDLCFVYSYIITIFLLVSGLYILGRLLIMNNMYVFVAMAFVLFTTNLDMFTDVYFSYHIFKVSFGFAEGLGMVCITLYYYIRLMREEKSQWALLLVTMLLLFATTGLKAPLAAVLLVGIAIGSVILMFVKGRPINGIVTGLCLLASFLVPMLLFVRDFHAQAVGATKALTISATDTMFHSCYFEKMHEFLTGIGVWGPLSYAVNFIGFLVFVFLIQLLVCIVTYKKRKHTEEDIIIFTMIFTGVALGMFVSQDGMSQMYFLLIAMVLSFFLSFSFLQDKSFEENKEKWLKGIFALGLLLLCVHYIKPAINSANNIASTFSNVVQADRQKETGLTITKNEMEGLRWGRDNLPNDAIILSNKVFFELGERSFCVSALTERQAYFESYYYSNVGKEMIDSYKAVIGAFYGGDSCVCERLRKEGVTHAIVFKFGKPNSYPSSCQKIFENKDMIIIKI